MLPAHKMILRTSELPLSGYMYSHLIRKLREYPIPEIRLPQAREWATPLQIVHSVESFGQSHWIYFLR